MDGPEYITATVGQRQEQLHCTLLGQKKYIHDYAPTAATNAKVSLHPLQFRLYNLLSCESCNRFQPTYTIDIFTGCHKLHHPSLGRKTLDLAALKTMFTHKSTQCYTGNDKHITNYFTSKLKLLKVVSEFAKSFLPLPPHCSTIMSVVLLVIQSYVEVEHCFISKLMKNET